MNIEDVLNKYFGDENHLYFHSSDALQMIEGDTMLRYVNKNYSGKVELWFCGNNGEFCIYITDDPKRLEALIKCIIY